MKRKRNLKGMPEPKKVKHQEFEIETTLSYTPFDGGKGYIVKVKSKKD